jgi:hypothetical protein
MWECGHLQKKPATCYIERMDYLMNEEIKSERSEGYYNVSQSDLRSLVRGELNVLKANLVKAKAAAS